MLRRELLEDEEQAALIDDALSALTPEEAGHLRTIVEELSRPEARDPKLAAVLYFLTEHLSEGKTWLDHGCIIFSQYYATTYSLGTELAKVLAEEPIGVYAGRTKAASSAPGTSLRWSVKTSSERSSSAPSDWSSPPTRHARG